MKPLFHLALAAIISSPVAAVAEKLPAPTGEILLTVSGKMENETTDDMVTMDLDQLQSLPAQTFTTSTIWLDDPTEFTGVSLRAVLDHAGVTGATIEAVALNDYKVEIPVDEITEDAPIIAYFMDGKPMSPRDKGPLWIVYPYDSDASYRSEVIYSRSIWQLDRINAVK